MNPTELCFIQYQRLAYLRRWQPNSRDRFYLERLLRRNAAFWGALADAVLGEAVSQRMAA
jgi:hypothetical protein